MSVQLFATNCVFCGSLRQCLGRLFIHAWKRTVRQIFREGAVLSGLMKAGPALPAPSGFSSRALLLSTCHSVMSVVCPWQNTPPPNTPLETWFLGSSGNFFSTSKKIFLLSLFYAFLDVFMPYWELRFLVHPKFNFHPKYFFNELWVKEGTTQCCQAF